MTLIRPLALALFLLVPAAASAGDEPAKKEPAKVQPATEDPVRLLEAGKEPRRALRHALPSGRTEKVRIDVSAKAGAEWPPAKPWSGEISGARVDLGVTCGIAARGRVPLAIGIADVVLPEEPEGASAPIARAKERTVEAVVTDRGLTVSARLGVEDGDVGPLLDLFRPLLLPILPPLPEKAVGIGARWETVGTVPVLEAEVRTEYRVVGFEKDRVRLDVRLSLTRAPGRVRHPSIPKGVIVDLRSLEVTGEGTILIDPGRPIATVELKLRAKAGAILLSPAGIRTAMGTFEAEVRAGPIDG